MRFLAVVASLAVAAAAAQVPASFGTTIGQTSPTLLAASSSDDERGPAQGADTRSEPEEDDDLDERLDGVDELVAVLDAEAPTFLMAIGETSWPVHDAQSPRAPSLQDTLRPPIDA